VVEIQQVPDQPVDRRATVNPDHRHANALYVPVYKHQRYPGPLHLRKEPGGRTGRAHHKSGYPVL
jgi:hypothetical protein